MWFLVNTNNLWLPQHDHNPSMKFRTPERVILLSSSDSVSSGFVGSNCFSFCGSCFFFLFLWSERIVDIFYDDYRFVGGGDEKLSDFSVVLSRSRTGEAPGNKNKKLIKLNATTVN